MSRSSDDFAPQFIALIAVSLIFGVVALFTGCTDQKSTESALTKQGFSDVEITGWKPWRCSDDDWYETGFIATNPKGERVEGVACSGLFVKNTTIRW